MGKPNLCQNCGLRWVQLGRLCATCFRATSGEQSSPPTLRRADSKNGAAALLVAARNRGLLRRGLCVHGRRDGECAPCEQAQRERFALLVPQAQEGESPCDTAVNGANEYETFP